MSQYRVSASRFVHAPAERVYSILADYEKGHALILPKPPFISMTVKRGGFGAGTEIELVMRVMGKMTTYHGVVSEPDAGRVLIERYVGTGTVTTFTVEPRDGGRAAEVTITTDTDVGSGIAAAIRGWLATRLLRPVYVEELEQLAAVAAR